MTELLDAIGLASGEMTQMIILAVVLLVGLFLLRTLFKLTKAVFRMGCFIILFVVVAAFILNMLN